MQTHIVTPTCDPGNWEAEAGWQDIEAYLWLRGKFEARLGYVRLSLWGWEQFSGYGHLLPNSTNLRTHLILGNHIKLEGGNGPEEVVPDLPRAYYGHMTPLHTQIKFRVRN